MMHLVVSLSKDEKVLVPFRHYYLTCYMPADSLALKINSHRLLSDQMAVN